MSSMQMRTLSYACQRTARPAFELKLCARSDRGQDPVDEVDSATGTVTKTHASVTAAADALNVTVEEVYSALEEGDALAGGKELALPTYHGAGFGTWKGVTQADVFAAADKSAPVAPAAGVRPYPPPPGALLDCLPAERCSPFA